MALRRLGLSFRFRRGLNLLNYLIENRLDKKSPTDGRGVHTRPVLPCAWHPIGDARIHGHLVDGSRDTDHTCDQEWPVLPCKVGLLTVVKLRHGSGSGGLTWAFRFPAYVRLEWSMHEARS